MRAWSWLLLTLPLLTGCPWISQGDHDNRVANLGGDDTAVDITDGDGDGYSSAVDCDDASAAVYPGADETCNGIDDDCDGDTDEDDAIDATTWYADDDGDGWGDEDHPRVGCTALSTEAGVAGDCDDHVASVNPDADELCDSIDNDCDGDTDEDDAVDAPTWYADDDGDGWGDEDHPRVACDGLSTEAEVAGDCDDHEASVSPDADELCDEIDNDCDGDTDEDDASDAVTWYADTDADGYGDPDSTTSACTMPSGYLSDSTDCDDSDAAINPAADELCDGVDNDCDGDTDESDAVDTTNWYLDGDSDGYGRSDAFTPACTMPSGYSATGDDCDDYDAAVNPGATEVCDLADNDCDGTADGASAVDATDWYDDADGDGYGDPATLERNCLAGSGHVDDDNDCDDGDAAINPGADEVCDGADNDCDGDTDEDEAIDVLTWYADTDGDSYGDASSVDIDCLQPTGFVADDQDCDDSDAAINPASDETCDGADNDCDGVTDEDEAIDAITWYGDGDGDGYGDPSITELGCSASTGYVADGGDCDDSDAAINPGASELCDGDDNDCDGDIDESDAIDAITYFLDEDGDGFGRIDVFEASCSAVAGYVTDSTDCLDSDADTYPLADEYCDGVDNDCDGTADSPSPVDAPTWYADADGDGYGTPGTTAIACAAPSGFGATDDDCDDGDAAINPGASEVWYDGFDQDCDGANDYDQDADGFDSDAHGGTDCDDTDDTINPDADDLGLNGIDEDCDGADEDDLNLGDAHFVLDGTSTGDRLGWSVSSAGDINGDTYDDIMIGAPEAGSGAGAVLVFYGPTQAGRFEIDDADVIITGDSGSGLGSAIASVGDINGDSYGDILLGASSQNTGGGMAYLIHGPITSDRAGDLKTASIAGGTAHWLGDFVGGGEDIDGDGYGDLLIGAPMQDLGYTDGGCLYVVSSGYTGAITASSYASITARARNTGAHIGKTACTGDYTGDGVHDLVVAGDMANVSGSYRGAAYLVTGDVGSGEYDFNNSDDYDGRIYGYGSSGYFGFSMANVGDIDNDGYTDLLVGAPRDYSTSSTGAAFLFLGPWTDGSGPWTSGMGSSVCSASFYGGAGDGVGYGVSGPGDLNGDGFDDWVVGVAYETPMGVAAAGADTGAGYIMLGYTAGSHSASTADGMLAGEGGDDLAGWVLAGAGDTDGDGLPDLLVGSPEYDDDAGSTTGPGHAYLITGLVF